MEKCCFPAASVVRVEDQQHTDVYSAAARRQTDGQTDSCFLMSTYNYMTTAHLNAMAALSVSNEKAETGDKEEGHRAAEQQLTSRYTR